MNLEKVAEINPAELTVFGIPIHSRYGSVREITSMISFCREIATAKLNRYVESVFYDSQSGLCGIKTTSEMPSVPNVHEAIADIARRNLCVFDLCGEMDIPEQD